MLVFSAITPHPPILIPGIGKENLKKLKKTVTALKKIEEELYAAKPDIIAIVSPHSQLMEKAFTINLSPDYSANFKEFGDFGTELKFKGDYLLSQQIRAADEIDKKMPIVLISNRKIDHGAAIPLYYLTPHLKNIKIIPFGYSGVDLKTHFEFGKFLQEHIANSEKRVAVIASGDLSHCLTKKSPAGFHKDGKIFDQKIVQLIKNKDISGILNLDKKLIANAKECGLKAIVILLGVITEANYEPEILSYEAPFGIGYAVVNFKLI